MICTLKYFGEGYLQLILKSMKRGMDGWVEESVNG